MESLAELGYLGLFIGSFLAATIIPFSSDILLIGLLAAGGEIIPTVIVATIGNWLGGMVSYWMGYAGKWVWIEKWFKIKEESLIKQKYKIDKYGAWLAFMSWLPGVGDLFAIGLGFYKVDAKKCALYMLIGKGVRFIGWAVAFYYLKPLFG